MAWLHKRFIDKQFQDLMWHLLFRGKRPSPFAYNNL